MINEALPLNRILDANLNRLREGIRVIEDIFRYLYNDKELAYKLKDIRHSSKIDGYIELLESRDSLNDCLKPSIKSETNRADLKSIVIANFKRAQESSRVLEELYKLQNIELSERFKSIRYNLYTLEKDSILKYFTLQDS